MTDSASKHSVSVRALDLSFGNISVLQNLNLDVVDGEFLVLLGSSGCGKSTLLNCIAGLLDISDGQIFIKDRNVTWEEPNERGIGMVFQSYALYPQMTVEGNLSFGLKNAGVPRAEIRSRVQRTAEILQIDALLKRKPAALSGGQRQRVAIGRALARDVDVFLFDEPLSNLDAKLRADLRLELKRLHRQLNNTMIYVTHDQVEAMTLADRIAIMRDGAIQQLGTPEEIYRTPMNQYVGGFIGSPPMNFIAGTLQNNIFSNDSVELNVTAYPFRDKQSTGPVTLGIRPEHVSINNDVDSCDLISDIHVELVEPTGADTLVLGSLSDTEFRVRTDGQNHVKADQSLKIGFNTKDISLFDSESGARL